MASEMLLKSAKKLSDMSQNLKISMSRSAMMTNFSFVFLIEKEIGYLISDNYSLVGIFIFNNIDAGAGFAMLGTSGVRHSL